MKSFKQYISEGRGDAKGWINLKTKKSYTTRGMRPYHVEFIIKKPRDFGLNKKQILDYLEKKYDMMDAPDPAEEAQKAYSDMLSGRIDIDRNIEVMAMKKGWHRVVGGSYASIGGDKKLTDRQVGVILSVMEDQGLIGAAAKVRTKEVALEVYEPYDRPDVNARVRYYGEVNASEIQNLIKGKPRGAKQTDIGRTMAMFREAVNECWSTHVQRGYKKKGGKMVPNCVPKNEDIEESVRDILRKLGRNKKVMSLVTKLKGQSVSKLAATLATIPIVQDTLASPDRMNQLRLIATGLRSMTEEDND